MSTRQRNLAQVVGSPPHPRPRGIAHAVLRARMVKLSWAVLRVPAIADEVGCGQNAVRRRLSTPTGHTDGTYEGAASAE
ncbi:hypothetical protein ACIOKD_37880 [Streptomyces sp. NPDC087844]|uniref:hypothetical protein n=1 Tax=Streptomyces sp. NPDC087844 TaxID=3365805 RepID=UPI00382D44DF